MTTIERGGPGIVLPRHNRTVQGPRTAPVKSNSLDLSIAHQTRDKFSEWVPCGRTQHYIRTALLRDPYWTVVIPGSWSVSWLVLPHQLIQGDPYVLKTDVKYPKMDTTCFSRCALHYAGPFLWSRQPPPMLRIRHIWRRSSNSKRLAPIVKLPNVPQQLWPHVRGQSYWRWWTEQEHSMEETREREIHEKQHVERNEENWPKQNATHV